MGVPEVVRGPPYFNAGLRISPDFLRISLALYGDCPLMMLGDSTGATGTIPVKSSFKPLLLDGLVWFGAGACGAAWGLTGPLLAGDLATLVIDGKWLSDSVRCTVLRRGMADPGLGPGDVDMLLSSGLTCEIPSAADGETWISGNDRRSGELLRELAAEDARLLPELSPISVKPNKRGRRPRRVVSWMESAAIATVRRGGDRTSGRTCSGNAMPCVIVPGSDLDPDEGECEGEWPTGGEEVGGLSDATDSG